MSYRADNLELDRHCFFGTAGGVSQGKYASLNTNLNSRDNQDNVMENFTRIGARFGLSRQDFFTIKQGVSNVAVYAEEPQWFKTYADGAVTDRQGVLLGIKTADCAPVLLADYKHGVIGAAHAGWRGAGRGIVENVVDLMVEKGAKKEDVCAAIGPCLQQQSFEAGDDLRQTFLEQSEQNEKYFAAGKDDEHFYFDLSGYIEDRLRKIGVENISNSKIDTYQIKNGYFSYRRNTHLQLIGVKNDYPTQYSCIML